MPKVITAFLLAIALVTGCAQPAETEDPDESSEGLFVFVRIPEGIMPIARGEKYEDPLDAKLKAAGHGEVTGGGTQMGPKKPDGSSDIAWVGVDVELADAEASLAALREALKELNAPKGTILEYSKDGKQVEEKLW